MAGLACCRAAIYQQLEANYGKAPLKESLYLGLGFSGPFLQKLIP